MSRMSWQTAADFLVAVAATSSDDNSYGKVQNVVTYCTAM